MQRPAAIQVFIFTFPEADSLGEIIDLIRKIKAANAVPTLIRATSDLYLASAQECNPCPQDGALWRAMRRRHLRRAPARIRACPSAV